jgi:lysophospholipase L1-like esterase
MRNSIKLVGLFFLMLTVLLHSCKKDKATPPILTTTEPTSITQKTVTSGGNITSDGGEDIIVAGICWSTSTGTSVKDNHTNDAKEVGSFESKLTGLTPNTKYYLKAYVYTKAAVSYGNEVSFTTLPIAGATLTTTEVTSITTNSAISGGNITSDGGGTISARGVCWSNSANPTTENSHTSDGTGTGSFASNITGLTANTTYHVRAYAINSAGTAYGSDVSFTTAVTPTTPTITTAAVSDITETSATSGGDVTSGGSSAVTARGVCWSTSANPTTENSHTSNGTGTGSFISNITGLTANTTYYVRAYAINSAGPAYGNENSFTTDQDIPTANPYFALPATGVSLLVGTEVIIYGDALINVPIVNNLSVTYTCDIGSPSGNNYAINPVPSDIGNHGLTMLFKEGNSIITTKTITLTVSDKVKAGNLKVLRIGDSTLGGEEIGAGLDLVLADATITYLGTQGTTRRNEGYGGYSFENFAADDVSPFRKAGVIDISAYFNDNSIAVPDIVYFRLGINDVFRYCASDITDANITGILNYADDIIDAFLVYNSDLKIVIAMPSTCASYTTGWNADYDESIFKQDKYIEIIHRFQSALVTKYAGGIYNERVDCSYEAIMLDRKNGYADGVHPNASGYVDLGNGLAPYINNYLK